MSLFFTILVWNWKREANSSLFVWNASRVKDSAAQVALSSPPSASFPGIFLWFPMQNKWKIVCQLIENVVDALKKWKPRMVNKYHGCTGREQLSHSLTTAAASNIFTWFNYTEPGYDRVQRCVTFAPPRHHSKLKCLTNRITFLNMGYPIRTHQETMFGMYVGKRR